MKIEITKLSPYKSQYQITRSNGSTENFVLETKTFFVHDISHYVVEQNLGLNKGFWGMLAQGHKFESLFGKENTLTAELRFIEQIVGPIQALYLGHFKPEDFVTHTVHLNINIAPELLHKCVNEIGELINKWRKLQIEQSLELIFAPESEIIKLPVK